mmetsp:Transcript_60211/g.111622  ORF Transcript_60211/g.111622 Transcript_60211/m.111622 type:complete len:213 (-) Transcript_60211:96-734(-)
MYRLAWSCAVLLVVGAAADSHPPHKHAKHGSSKTEAVAAVPSQAKAQMNQSMMVVQAAEDKPSEPFHCVCNRGPPPPPCTSQCVAVVGAAPAAAVPPGPYADVDINMPYGNLEPFGREDTAQELTESSIKESDAMVDQLERAEVAEEKRAVFRALTRLRGAAIASFDGIAHSQTGNIDQYAKTNKWREAHPVQHLATEEADVYKWAFPEQSS